MREHLGKYILRRKVNLVVKMFLDSVGEGLIVDEERRRNNKSVMSKGQKCRNSMYFFT